MRKATFVFVALVIVAVAVLISVWVRFASSRKTVPAPPPPRTIVRIYFDGAANLAADTNSTAFTNIFCCSQARVLLSQTLDKLARAPGAWFKHKLPAGAADGSAQLRPLLNDMITSKWVLEMREGVPSPEYALAIQLNDARARLWQTNFRSLLESWTHIQARDVPGGWELKKDMPPDLFRIVRATNGWLVIGCGQDVLPLSDAWADGAETPDTNETNWASVTVDWPRLAEIFPVFAKFDLPAMHMQITGRGGELLPSGAFELSQPLPALPSWQIPTNIIHQPLTSFTAVRGFAPWLEKQPWWPGWLKLSPEPDQAFIWSLGSSPFQMYAAVHVTNGAIALATVERGLAGAANWNRSLANTFALVRTNNRVFFRNFPLMTPEVQSLKASSGDFLLAELFPNPPFGKAPPGLFEQVNHPDVVFYHWEMTAQRLKNLPEPTQLALLLTKHRQLDTKAAAGQWLEHIGPLLGNCVTEVTRTGPSELAFRRSGSAGLTAIELMALAEWLEAPNFPGCDMSLPPHRPPSRHLPPPHPQGKARHPQISHPPARQTNGKARP